MSLPLLLHVLPVVLFGFDAILKKGIDPLEST